MRSFKKIVLSLALGLTGAIAYVAVAAGPEYTFSCDNGYCQTDLDQGQNSWTLTIDCDDGNSGAWSGSGTWTGTICGVEFGGG